MVTRGVGDSSSGDGDDEEREMATVVGMGIGSPPPPVFGMEDLRFFQHFVLDAIPPLPVGGGEVWRGVARMAHEVSFYVLLHRISCVFLAGGLTDGGKVRLFDARSTGSRCVASFSV